MKKYTSTPVLVIKTIEGRRSKSAKPALTGAQRAAAVRRLRAARGESVEERRLA